MTGYSFTIKCEKFFSYFEHCVVYGIILYCYDLMTNTSLSFLISWLLQYLDQWKFGRAPSVWNCSFHCVANNRHCEYWYLWIPSAFFFNNPFVDSFWVDWCEIKVVVYVGCWGFWYVLTFEVRLLLLGTWLSLKYLLLICSVCSWTQAIEVM